MVWTCHFQRQWYFCMARPKKSMVTASSSAKAGQQEKPRPNPNLQSPMNTPLTLEKGDSPPRVAMIALSDYQAPTMPTEHVMRRLWKRVKSHIQSLRQSKSVSESESVLLARKFEPATLKALDKVAGPPAYGPLLDEFDDALAEWRADPAGLRHYLAVLPPCDSNDVIAAWAQSRGHATLDAPPRHRLHEAQPIRFPEAEDDALLVIPRLEHWFLRHRNGLASVRALFAELAESRRRCLIGCNSWAWAFLVKSAGAELVLPRPMCFAPFDTLRLQQWFSELAAQETGGPVVFRLAGSGADVLQKKDDGHLNNSYLEQLASRSHGIPWVAWHQWRQSLRTSLDTDESPPGITKNDGRTLWITDDEDTALPLELPLPVDEQENGLLMLHALLLHGALSAAELAAVLPAPVETGVIAALLRAGFIQKQGILLAPQADAYPAMRSALKAAGFPLGKV